MTVLDSIGWILLHLRKYVSYDARVVIGRLLGAGDIDGDVGELWPGESMVEVVFHKVVLRQIGNVCMLYMRYVRRP